MLGWTDPKDQDASKVMDLLQKLQLEKNVYPDHIMEGKTPPSCIFVPSTSLLLQMIDIICEAQSKHDDNAELLYRFCDSEPPPP